MALNIPWTKPALAELRKQLHEGKTYSVIGEYFGKTRGAIASAVRRYYYMIEDKRKKSKPTDEQEKKEVEERLAPLLFGPLPVKRYLEQQEVGVKYPDPRFLSDGYCRAIVGDPRGLTCCGKITKGTRVYCDDHHAEYNEKPKDERALERFARIYK